MRTRWWLVLLCFVGIFSSLSTCALIGISRLPASMRGRDTHVEEAEQRRVAVHEAGHAVVAALLQGQDEVTGITVFADVNDGLYGICHTKNENRLETAEDLMKEASVFLGGRAADKLVNGAPTTGATSDLANVSRIIWRMHLENGLGQSLLVQDKDEAPDEVRTAVEEDINHANACAEGIVATNKAEINALADVIMAKPAKKGERELTKDEIKAFFSTHAIKLPRPTDGGEGPCDFTAP